MKNKIITVVFAVMLTAFALLLFIGKSDNSVADENREAAKMPEFSADAVLSGEFAEDTESFIGDNIGFRSFFISLNEKLSAKKGISVPEGRIVTSESDIGTNETRKSEFLIANDSVFELFSENKPLADKYADAVNYYAPKLNPEITLYCAVIPTAIEFQDEIYANLQDSQRGAIDYIEGSLDSRVKTVDIYSAMQNHSGEYEYFRTDHHWTQLGAYYGYTAFCAAAGIAPVDKNEFEQNKIANFLGSLYTQVSASELAEKPDTIEWFDTNPDGKIDIFMRRYKDGKAETYKSPIFNKTEPNYRFFLSGDNPLVCLTNKNNPDGKTLVIVRDSFANAFAPWVIQNYSRVVLVDPRSCGADFSEIIDEFQPDEVLIMNYVFAASFEDYSSLLTGLYSAP